VPLILHGKTNKDGEEQMHTATPQQVTPQWLRFAAAESYSGLGRTTLTRLINTGEIRAARIGKSIRVNRLSLDEYMERHVFGGIEG
jgi:excisionase family DNA binding protein